MKKAILSTILAISVFLSPSSAQTKQDSGWISKTQLVGTWQRGDSLVGSGLGQNFQFFSDNTFVFHIGNDGDDVRNIIALKGKYRLVKNMIYFTVISRKVIEGSIEISDPGISLNIFNITPGTVKEIPEKNTKEIADPCYITLIRKAHIKIDNEQYYKVK